MAAARPRPGRAPASAPGEPSLPLVAEADELCVEHQAADPRSMLSLYRRLGALRRASAVLQQGEQRFEDAGDGGCSDRERAGERLVAAINFATEPRAGSRYPPGPVARWCCRRGPDRETPTASSCSAPPRGSCCGGRTGAGRRRWSGPRSRWMLWHSYETTAGAAAGRAGASRSAAALSLPGPPRAGKRVRSGTGTGSSTPFSEIQVRVTLTGRRVNEHADAVADGDRRGRSTRVR